MLPALLPSWHAPPAAAAAAPRFTPPAEAPTPAPGPATGRAPGEDRDLDEVSRLLDGGDAAAASILIARLRGSGRDSARLFFLDAVCALDRGDRNLAERALRGALYLDGGFAMAHYLLAQMLTEAGRADAARRALANAAGALAAAPPDDPVVEGDGRTAAELREVIRARLVAIDAA